MQFGDTLIKCCTECSGLIEQQTIMSGNTFGARLWTDGKMDAPMLPRTPSLVKCPHCRSIIWLGEQSIVAEIEARNSADIAHGAKGYWTLSAADYFKFIAENELDQTDERNVRIYAWWVANDKRRGATAMCALSNKERENLQALEPLMELANVSDRIMAAEIKRELGQFDAATELLKAVLNDELGDTVATIFALAKKKDPFVREIVMESESTHSA